MFTDSIKDFRDVKVIIDMSFDDVLRSKIEKVPRGIQEKKEEIWLSPVTKTPTPTEQSKKQRDNIKTPPKTLITQLLRTDLGRSVGVTAVT